MGYPLAMAIAPPQHVPVTPPSPEMLRARHDAAVVSLEATVDTWLRGQQLVPGAAVEVVLPLGDHAPEVLAELEEHYVVAGWVKATVEDDKGPPPRGLVLTLVPAA